MRSKLKNAFTSSPFIAIAIASLLIILIVVVISYSEQAGDQRAVDDINVEDGGSPSVEPPSNELPSTEPPSTEPPTAESGEPSDKDDASIPADVSGEPVAEEEIRWEDIVDVDMPYALDIFLDNLEVPWALEIAEDGRFFFTERPGRVRVYKDGQLVPQPVITLPDTYHRSEGGLLGLALHPQFAENNLMYIYQTYLDGNRVQNRVLRLLLTGDEAEIDQVIIDQLPGANNHNGGRLKIGPDEKLYVTTGEIYQIELAQQLDNLGGKILRLELDGSIPADNPFPDSPIYSWGHRNPQGLAWHPDSQLLFSSEHGQSAHDEINIIAPGQNYGWPIIEGDQQADDMISPIIHSGRETWAPSGATFVTHGPWRNNLLVSNLRGQQLIRFIWDDTFHEQLEDVIYLYKGEYGRIRDIYEGPDGTIYFLTNNRDGRGNPIANDDRIMMLVPQWPRD